MFALMTITPLVQSRRCTICGWTERAPAFSSGDCYSAAERAAREI